MDQPHEANRIARMCPVSLARKLDECSCRELIRGATRTLPMVGKRQLTAPDHDWDVHRPMVELNRPATQR
jgi:hypothetical protein